MRRITNRGDTIIEVLIAILIISVLLGTAYSTVSHSANNARQSQERSVAIGLMESQTERLKTLASTPGNTVFKYVNWSCVNNSNQIKEATDPAHLRPNSAVNPPYLDPNQDDFSEYTNVCTDSAHGIPYYLSIQREDSGSTHNFIVRVRWERAGGGNSGGHEQASVNYRLWP